MARRVRSDGGGDNLQLLQGCSVIVRDRDAPGSYAQGEVFSLAVPQPTPPAEPVRDPYDGYADDWVAPGQPPPQPKPRPKLAPPSKVSPSQARQELFQRQAALAAELTRLGMPPMAEWTQGVQCGQTKEVSADQSATHTPPWRRGNPIIQHQRKVSSRLAHMQQITDRALSEGVGSLSTELIGERRGARRQVTLDGFTHVRVERVQDEIPSNESEGGNLWSAPHASFTRRGTTGTVGKSTGKLQSSSPQHDVSRVPKERSTPPEPHKERIRQLRKDIIAAMKAGVEIGVDTSTAALAQPAPSSTPAQPGIGSPAAQAVPASSALTGPAHDTRESSPRQPHVHKTIDSIQVIRDASCEGHTVVLYPLRVRAVSPNKTPGHAAGHQAVTAGPQAPVNELVGGRQSQATARTSAAAPADTAGQPATHAAASKPPTGPQQPPEQPTAEDLGRFQDVSDCSDVEAPAACESSHDSWGIDNTDVDRRGFPRTLADACTAPALQQEAHGSAVGEQPRSACVSNQHSSLGGSARQGSTEAAAVFIWPSRPIQRQDTLVLSDDSDVDSTGSWGVAKDVA